jgi:hypothetical protein
MRTLIICLFLSLACETVEQPLGDPANLIDPNTERIGNTQPASLELGEGDSPCVGDLMIASIDDEDWIAPCAVIEGQLTIQGSPDYSDVYLPQLQYATEGIVLIDIDRAQIGGSR